MNEELVSTLRSDIQVRSPVEILFALADACQEESQEGLCDIQERRNLLRVSVIIRDLSDLILMYPDEVEQDYKILKEFLGLNKKEDESEIGQL